MMEDNYEKFKEDVFKLTKIDLNAYKEKQMKRRIDTLISKSGMKSYNEYVALIKKDKEKFLYNIQKRFKEEKWSEVNPHIFH